MVYRLMTIANTEICSVNSNSDTENAPTVRRRLGGKTEDLNMNNKMIMGDDNRLISVDKLLWILEADEQLIINLLDDDCTKTIKIFEGRMEDIPKSIKLMGVVEMFSSIRQGAIVLNVIIV